MISDRLKELILPYLKMRLEPEQYKYIDSMFNEVYKTTENGFEVVTLAPPPKPAETKGGVIAMQFLTLNGAFYGIDFWEEVQRRGTKI